MLKTTSFYPRTSVLNETMLWDHWAGYAAAVQYQFSETLEYFAIRNAAALFDTSPLFKYRFKGADAERFLMGVLARDIRRCSVGRSQYTLWCDDRGFVLEDGVISHVEADEFWLTAARPNLFYFDSLAAGYDVDIEDISADYALLALQGPHSKNILERLTKKVTKLGYFALTDTKIKGKLVMISRTGFTGDLGYELWIQTADALTIWDAIMEAGQGYNLIPMGLTALSMARIEAGLLLIEIDFESSRHAWVDEQRSSPLELGFGWMFRNLKKDDRAFIGRAAIEKELATESSRWYFVGLEIDWQEYEKIYNEVGLIAPKDGVLVEEAHSIYDKSLIYVGYATSFMYSPILKRHIALAKLPPAYAKIGTAVKMEIMVNHRPKYITANVVKTPFFNPDRKIGN